MSTAPGRISKADLDVLLDCAARAGDERAAAIRLLASLCRRHAVKGPNKGAKLLKEASAASAPAALLIATRGGRAKLAEEDPGILLAAGAAALLDRQDSGAAIDALMGAVGADGDIGGLVSRLLELALLADDQHEALAELLGSKAVPGLAPVEVRRAEALRRAGDPGTRLAYAALLAEGPDPYAFSCLEEWLQDHAGAAELADLYKDASRRELDPGMRALFRYRLGEVLEASGEPEAAAEAFALAAEGDLALAARERSRALYRKEQDWDRYGESLRKQAEAVGDPRRAAALLLLAGRTLMEAASDPVEAIRWLRDARSLSPRDGRIAEMLAEAYLRAGDTESLASLHEGPMRALLARQTQPSAGLPFACTFVTADAAGDVAGLAESCRGWAPELAEGPTAAALATLAGVLADGDAAARRDLEAATAMDPSFVAAHLVRARSAFSAGRLREAQMALAAAAEITPSAEQASEMLLEATEIVRSLGDPERIADLYRRVVDRLLGGREPELSTEELASRLTSGGAWGAHRDALVAEARRAGHFAALAPVLRDEGRLAEDPTVAERLLYEALALTPHDAKARESLAVLLDGREAWSELADLFESSARAATSAPERADLLGRAAMVARGPLEDAERADRDVDRAEATSTGPLAVVDPDEGAVDQAERLFKRASREDDWDTAVSQFLHAAELFLEGEAPSRAIEAYHEVLARDSGELRAVAALADLYRRVERFEDAADMLRRLSDRAAEPAVARDLLLARGRLLEEDRGDAEGASAVHEECAARFPDCAEALAALDRLYSNLGKPGPRHDALVRLLGLTSGPHRDELVLEVARLEIDAGRPGDAVRRLAGAPDADIPALAALRLLAQAAGDAGDHAAAAAALERLARHISDPAERSLLYLEVAVLYRDHLGGGGVVLENAMLAFMCDNDHAAAFETLERLYVQAGRWREVVGVYDLALARARAGGPYDEAALLRRKGMAEARHLDRPREAVQTLLRALEVDPGDDEPVAALETLLTATGDPASRLRMMEIRAEATAGKERAELLSLAAELSTEAGDHDGAVGFLERAFVADGESGAISERLSAALHRAEKWSDLARLHRYLADRAADPGVATEHLRQAAAVLESSLHDLPAAAAALERAVALVDDDREALAGLARLYEATRQWERLLEISEREVSLAETGEERGAIKFRIGSVLETWARDEGGAEEAYREALQHDRRCFSALHGLRDIHIRRGEWEKALATLEAEVRLWDDARDRANILHRMAQILLERCDDRDGAAEAWRRALEALGDHTPSVEGLLDLLVARGEWEEAAPLARALTRLAADGSDEALRRHALATSARVALARGDLEAAAETLVVAVGIDGSHPATLAVLADLVESPEAGGLPGPLLDDLEAAIESLGGDRGGLAWVRLLRGRSAEADARCEEALGHYREAVDVDPSAIGARRALAVLLGRLRRWEEAAGTLAEAADRGGADDHWLDFLLDAADIRLDRLGDVEGAVHDYERALHALGPSGVSGLFRLGDALPAEAPAGSAPDGSQVRRRRALFGLAQSHRLANRHREAIREMRRLVELERSAPAAVHGPASAGRYQHFLARLIEEGSADLPAAVRTYRSALEAAPGDPVCAIGLARALLHSGEPDAADEALAAAFAAVTEGNGAAAGAKGRIARFRARSRERLGDREAAVDILSEAAATASNAAAAADLRCALADVYLRSFEQGASFALSCYHQVLRDDATSSLALAGLEEVYRQADQADKVRCIRSIRCLVDPSVDEEWVPSEDADWELERPIEGDVVGQFVLHPGAQSPMWTVWPAAQRYLAQVYEPGRTEDPPGEPLPLDEPKHPVAAAVRAVLAMLGTAEAGELALRLVPGSSEVRLIAGAAPVLIVGSELTGEGSDPAELIFLVARALAFLLDPRHLATAEAEVAGPAAAEVHALFRAAAGTAEGRGAPVDLPKQVVKAARAALAADMAYGDAEPDPDAFLLGVRRTADRLALVACGDAAAALRALAGRAADEPASCAAAVRERADLADLVRWAVSEDHFFVRRSLTATTSQGEA